jgi:hypothetical protein
MYVKIGNRFLSHTLQFVVQDHPPVRRGTQAAVISMSLSEAVARRKLRASVRLGAWMQAIVVFGLSVSECSTHICVKSNVNFHCQRFVFMQPEN